MVEPTIIVAIITAASLIYTATIKAVSDQLGNHKKTDKSEENALSPQSVSAAVSSPNLPEQNVRLQSLARRMDRMKMKAKSLDRRTIIIRAEGFELDRRADEAVNTYGTNVLVIMLFHGLGSIFLQLNYPYSGTSVSVLMVVSFFSTFVIAYIVSSNNIEKMSQLGKDLRRRQRELKNDIANFGAEIMGAYPNEDFKTLARIGAIGEDWNFTRNAQALQSDIDGLLEMSSNLESNRITSLFQVKVWAIMYGLSFPMMACYLLHSIDFRRKRFVY